MVFVGRRGEAWGGVGGWWGVAGLWSGRGPVWTASARRLGGIFAGGDVAKDVVDLVVQFAHVVGA